jgi:hypothetical protein
MVAAEYPNQAGRCAARERGDLNHPLSRHFQQWLTIAIVVTAVRKRLDWSSADTLFRATRFSTVAPDRSGAS